MAQLTHLAVENVRIIENARLEPSPGLNYILGPNASGKSSLLEAIYFLARARSFREPNWRAVRREGADYLRVVGGVVDQIDHRSRVGVERSEGGLSLRVDGHTERTARVLLAKLPLLLVEPESHRLIEQGPAYRRRFLDWGVFHVEQRFFPAWQRYRRAWRQRNALLRQSAAQGLLDPWETEMELTANELDQQRERYVQALEPLVGRFGIRLLDVDDLTLRYQRGWPADAGLGTVLERARETDRKVGYTRHGPHRADLGLCIEGFKAAERVSRGQQKLLVFCLALAQAKLLETAEAGARPVLLADDLAAELDQGRIERLIALLQEMGLQVFATGTDESRFAAAGAAPGARFHVEHGRVTAVV